ncbi:ExbD/TolR family protein [Zavarzinella formosa]|uniref:ExbD/TolR family protein n=1 Tax=Zavarzinella formosa TaxID=360055 RepID=UPI0002DCACE0|nr:biopolymer transporter ExbD [Zavarzinella formosa]
MNLFNVRHEGSPESVDGVTAEEILDGVKEGIWEPTDEVQGPGEHEWQSLELHPVFETAMADFEPPPPPKPEDETKLDMNPLIDVALVLLIFFMLTATYEQLRKEFTPPPAEGSGTQGQKVIKDPELRTFTIRVTAKMENDQLVYRVENEVVPEDSLEAKLKEWLEKTGYSKLAEEIDPKAPWRAVVKIQDAAAGAKISEIIRVTRQAKE